MTIFKHYFITFSNISDRNWYLIVKEVPTEHIKDLAMLNLVKLAYSDLVYAQARFNYCQNCIYR